MKAEIAECQVHVFDDTTSKTGVWRMATIISNHDICARQVRRLIKDIKNVKECDRKVLIRTAQIYLSDPSRTESTLRPWRRTIEYAIDSTSSINDSSSAQMLTRLYKSILAERHT